MSAWRHIEGLTFGVFQNIGQLKATIGPRPFGVPNKKIAMSHIDYSAKKIKNNIN
jgi:hypothetical protein